MRHVPKEQIVMQPRGVRNPPARGSTHRRGSQVALMVWEGLPNRDIAAGNTTAQVIKNYLRNPVAKLGWSRLELAL
jgi:DNA-binding NarL/FixJ family response regulator